MALTALIVFPALGAGQEATVWQAAWVADGGTVTMGDFLLPMGKEGVKIALHAVRLERENVFVGLGTDLVYNQGKSFGILGLTLWDGPTPEVGSPLQAHLGFGVRFSPGWLAAWHHWSCGSLCEPNHGEDTLAIGYRTEF